MACTGIHCDQHGTGTTTCSGHRASCSTNRELTLTTDFASATGRIRAADIDALRANIRAEVSRYNLHGSFSVGLLQGTAYTTSTVADNSHVNDFETMVQAVNNVNEPVGSNYAVLTDPADSTTSPNSYGEGSLINRTHWTTIKAKYDVMRQDCICNADCACNLVCNCHNDCGCNYA